MTDKQVEKLSGVELNGTAEMAVVESEHSATDQDHQSSTSSSYECASTNSTSNNRSGDLPHRWAVWHYKRPAQGGRGRVEKVAVLGSQQELLAQLKEVNLFEQKDAVSVNVFVFRDGIKPDKFDPANKDGGCWAVFAPDDLDPANKTLVCQWWVKLLSVAVKELLDEHEDVVGVRVAIRNPHVAGASAIKDDQTVAQGLRDRVELWTRNASDQEKQVNIGRLRIPRYCIYNIGANLGHMKYMKIRVWFSERLYACIGNICDKIVS
eukprot:TRINITY_DN3868_c0_g1_i5.p2 TRINITY_DN3868_c0_g1~~TRINITY_DN3868_c0_g1_i5.p2  ORF type:complete len:265 (+),score=29.10 TRINITY_DN3868_c0_g1_i5:538-1332(+)